MVVKYIQESVCKLFMSNVNVIGSIFWAHDHSAPRKPLEEPENSLYKVLEDVSCYQAEGGVV